MIVCLGKQNALVLDERMQPSIEYAIVHIRIDRLVWQRCEQFHVDRDGKFVTDNLTGFVADGAAVQIDYNALTVEEIHFRLADTPWPRWALNADSHSWYASMYSSTGVSGHVTSLILHCSELYIHGPATRSSPAAGSMLLK